MADKHSLKMGGSLRKISRYPPFLFETKKLIARHGKTWSKEQVSRNRQSLAQIIE
jgi:hypothetical protein